MAHAFDTGLALPQRTLIRRGAVQLLSGLLRANGGYLAAVIRWGGVVRGYTDERGIELLTEALNGRAPAIAIALGDYDTSPAGMGGFNFKGPMELTAYHYASSLRDETDGRTEIDAVGLASNLADPGLDVMLEHARELLVGQRCGASATIKQIVPTREEELVTENGFTLWAQRYSVTVSSTINPNRGVTQILDEIRANVRTSDVVTTAIANAPTGATMAGSVATFTTTTPHELGVGAIVEVAGVAIAGYNGRWLITATPTTSSFKATLDAAGLGASGGGTVSGPPVAATQNLLPP